MKYRNILIKYNGYLKNLYFTCENIKKLYFICENIKKYHFFSQVQLDVLCFLRW